MNSKQPTWQGRIVLALGIAAIVAACSTNKNAQSTTAEDKSQTIASAPLNGLSKNPPEEVIRMPDPAIIAKAEAAPPTTESLKRDMGSVYFPFDRWALPQEGKKALLDDIEYLKQHPAANLLIEGYCDERGSRDYNLVLGEKRAREVFRHLMALGTKNAVKIISFGKERPVCMEHDESCYWKNRRAHLLVENGK